MPIHDCTAKAGVPDRLARWERRISDSSDRIAEALRRETFLILLLFSVFYFFVTCLRASRKLFWFDELFTLYISRLPDLQSIWSALKVGADLNPPLLYIFTRFCESFLGEGQIATRLPEILGFWIFCLCLFRFVSSRTSVVAGLISMLFPLITTAYFYAYEARSYGIVLGFGGIALLCWQAATRSQRRGGWLCALFLALFCATITHPYAVLLLVPFVFAEMVRWVFLRRFDRAVWAVLIASSLGVLVSLPLWRASKVTIPPAAFPATAAMLANSYQSLLGPAVIVLSTALILFCAAELVSPNRPIATNREEPLLPEIAMVVGFLAMPLFSFSVAKLTGAPFLSRYSLSAVIGFGCLLGVLSAKRTAVGLGVLVLLIAVFARNFLDYMRDSTITEPTTAIALGTAEPVFADKYQAMTALPDKSTPIVLLDDLEFLPLMYYAPADIAARLVYMARPASDVNGEGYLRLQRFCRLRGHVAQLADFLSTHDTCHVYCNSRSLYRLKEFVSAGGVLRVESSSDDSFLLWVTFKNRQGEPDSEALY